MSEPASERPPPFHARVLARMRAKLDGEPEALIIKKEKAREGFMDELVKVFALPYCTRQARSIAGNISALVLQGN